MAVEQRSVPCLPIHFELMQLWQRMLGREVRHVDESFIELGGGPLVAAMLERVAALTRKRVAAPEFLKAPTIRGLAQNLVTQTGTDSVFQCIQSGNGCDPFYYFHGDILGGGFYAARLAAYLGAERPVYVTAPLQLPDHHLPTVEMIAARKRRALQRLQPHGPYVLGGFCVGAVVAYEVARQLEAEGERVLRVILIEPEIGNALTRSHQHIVNRLVPSRRCARQKADTFARGVRMIERLTNVWNAPWPEKSRFVINNTRRLFAKARPLHAATNVSRDRPAETEQHLDASPREWLLSAYRWIVNAYVPRRLNGQVTLLVTEHHLKETPFITRQWKAAAPHARVELVVGEHLTCITTHLDTLARNIRRELEAVKSILGFALSTALSEAWFLAL